MAAEGSRSLAVGFVARERYSWAARALAALLERCRRPFALYIVDGRMPERRRKELDGVLRGRRDARYIEAGRYLLPNEAKHLVLSQSAEDYVLMLENDCLVEPGAVEALLEAAARFQSAVTVPVLIERNFRGDHVHHDGKLGRLRENPDGTVSLIPDPEMIRAFHKEEEARRVEFFENHCLLLDRRRVGALERPPDYLNVDEHIDLALRLRKAGLAAVMEPRARVRFQSPPPILADEREFYLKRWDVEKAARSNAFVRAHWRISAESMTNAARFAARQHYRTSVWRWALHRSWVKLLRRFGFD